MPEGTAVLTLVLAALAIMGSPGPSTISLTAVAASFGARRVVPYLIGLILGTVAVLLIVATGITTALLSLPLLSPVLIGASLVYIAYLAFRIATAPPLGEPATSAAAPSLAGGIALGVANPKAYVAIGAVFAANRLATDPMGDAVAKLVILAGMIAVIHLVWLAAGALIAGSLRDPVTSRIVNVTLKVALVAFSALALLPHGT